MREALALINETLDETLAEQEGDFDADSRWALVWFEQSGFAEGEYGVAETLSKAKNTSVAGMVEAGILASSRGKVRRLRPDELPADWDPEGEKRGKRSEKRVGAQLTPLHLTPPAWSIVHHLIRSLEAGGEGAAAELVTNPSRSILSGSALRPPPSFSARPRVFDKHTIPLLPDQSEQRLASVRAPDGRRIP